MRSHKTGCNRCRRPTCCCAGPPGPPGSNGLPGPAGEPSVLLKFSGRASPGDSPAIATNYYADVGAYATAPQIGVPQNYPVNAPFTANRLSATATGITPGDTLTVTLLRNGAPTGLTLVLTDVDPDQTIAVPEVFLPGHTFDLQTLNAPNSTPTIVATVQ